ncbi:MAG: tetratricopeptide repeat protein [Flavobacteriales bacterium]|nr:tetratricopeptide repeat protein [Flavobacteriales bacterium]
MTKFWYIILFLTFPVIGFSDSTEDSLLTAIHSVNEDTIKAKNYCKLSNYFRQINLEKAVIYSDTALLFIDKVPALQQAEIYDQRGLTLQSNGEYERSLENYNKAFSIREKENDREGLGVSLNNIGISYYYQGKYEDALRYFQQAGEIKIETRDSVGAARAFNNTGIMYDIGGKPAKAIESYLIALKIYEEAGRTDMQIGTIQNIGLIYSGQKEYRKALNYYLKSVRLSDEIDDKDGQQTSLNNAGTAYDNLAEYDSAATLYHRALNIANEIGSKRGIALTHNNLAVNVQERGLLDSAIYHYLLALPLKIELGNKAGIAVSQLGLAEVYYRLEKPQKAIEYLGSALKNAEETGYVEYIRQSYRLLSSSHAQAKNFEQAYEYQTLFIQLKDSLLNEENSKIINELNTKYETEKKEQQIAIQSLENDKLQSSNARQKVMIFASCGGVILMLVLAFVLFRSNQQKQRANNILEERNELISRQRDEIIVQKRELTDSIDYAKTIQDSILPSKEIISKSLPNHFVLFQPKNVVSGDFYWFAEVKNTTIIAAIDCTGHGVPGALVSMVGANLLNQIVIERGIVNPGEILFQLNNEIRNVFQKEGNISSSNDGMDMALCAISGNKLKYAGAKNPLFHVNDGLLSVTKGTPDAIGGHTAKDSTYKCHELILGADDMCYIFSDGFQDQFGGKKGKKFMVKNFKSLLSEIFTEPLHKQQEILTKKINEWKSGYEQIDDICVIGFKV